jgi:sRNA-binding carbon storage regulator CsrA
MDSLIIRNLRGGADIKVTVVGFSPTQGVRLAIEAPDSYEVIREELMYRGEGWQGRDYRNDKKLP